VGAVFRKELREYRRNGNIIYATAILPLVFMVQPLIQVFTLPSSASAALHARHPDAGARGAGRLRSRG
jgi:hypothetical protein